MALTLTRSDLLEARKLLGITVNPRAEEVAARYTDEIGAAYVKANERAFVEVYEDTYGYKGIVGVMFDCMGGKGYESEKLVGFMRDFCIYVNTNDFDQFMDEYIAGEKIPVEIIAVTGEREVS